MKSQHSESNARLELNPHLMRVAWFVGLWLAGVISMAVLVYVIRWAIHL